jgi:thiamine biosynthesis lipoprotein
MSDTRLIMGMPITIDVVDDPSCHALEVAFQCFVEIDARFSPYKEESELSAMNRGEHCLETISPQMREVLELAELTRHETRGYFDIRRPDGRVDPSGLVKGWAIRKAARAIEACGFAHFLVEAGGDVQCGGCNREGKPWRIGIRNPFDSHQVIKIVSLGEAGVATSGTYVRGTHIYDPHRGRAVGDEIASVTVVARDIYDADRFATAAFAMGRDGIAFIEDMPGLEGYVVTRDGVAVLTPGFARIAC